MEKLNQFKLYKALADIHDYSLQPLATLRLEDGKLQKNCILLEQTPRIQGALYFLQELGLVDREQLERVQGMSMQQREQEELCLKRGAVSAFVGDIVQTTSDTLWINHTLDAFSFSFQKIIEKIGMPIVATQRVKVQGQDGEDRFMRIVKVLFPQTPNNGEKSPIKYVLPQKDCSK